MAVGYNITSCLSFIIITILVISLPAYSLAEQDNKSNEKKIIKSEYGAIKKSISNMDKKNDSDIYDKFGIKKIHRSMENGREFFSHWDLGGKRVLHFGDRDPIDKELIVRGKNAELLIDGKGIGTLKGKDSSKESNPRIYVYDEAKAKKWNNVEITFYAKRISELISYSYAGFNVAARSEHQDVSEENLEAGGAYYGRLTYNGRIQFVKEVEHGTYKNSSEEKFDWQNPDNSIPTDKWIGIKFIVRTIESSGHVKLELYVDLSNGKDGGNWKKMSEYIDDGLWAGSKIFNEPSTSIFIRNDGLGYAQYKNFSIREIEPIL